MNPCAWNASVLVCTLLCISVSGCSEPTVGQQFRDIMAEIDAKCRKEGLGPYLNPGEPSGSRKRTDGSCDILKIKPVDPMATEEGRFAYSIKLPPPHDKPKVEYKKGMSAEAYFKELCEKEEGDFIFRSVEGVDGIRIMRPMPIETGVPLWNEVRGPSPGEFVSHINGIYQYIEAVEPVIEGQMGTQLVRYKIDSNLPTNKSPWGMVHFPIAMPKARYGFTFRNSSLENREYGILGQELIILDLNTIEVLGLRRRFTLRKFDATRSVQIMVGPVCRALSTEDSSSRFIARVLKPVARFNGGKI